jgi:hypothetical protein
MITSSSINQANFIPENPKREILFFSLNILLKTDGYDWNGKRMKKPTIYLPVIKKDCKEKNAYFCTPAYKNYRFYPIFPPIPLARQF